MIQEIITRGNGKFSISGLASAGKTTLANEIIEASAGKLKAVKFAEPIYKALDALDRPKHRRFMQDFGDLCRLHFGDSVFEDAFSKKIKGIDFVCDDVRRFSEFDVCKENGALHIHCVCNDSVRKNRMMQAGTVSGKHNSEDPQQMEYIMKHADIVLDTTDGYKLLDTSVGGGKKMSVYLGGAMRNNAGQSFNIGDEPFVDDVLWRSVMKDVFRSFDFKDPWESGLSGTVYPENIVDSCYAMIDQCKIGVWNLSGLLHGYPCIGSLCEIGYAHDKGMAIIILDSSGKFSSHPFIRAYHKVVSSQAELMEELERYSGQQGGAN